MPDTELLDILKIICEVVGDQKTDRNFDSHTVQPSNGSSCKVNSGQWIEIGSVSVVHAYSNMPEYFRHFRSTINREADKRACPALMQKINNKYSDAFHKFGVLMACLAYRR